MPLPSAPRRRADILTNDSFNRTPHRAQRLDPDPPAKNEITGGAAAQSAQWLDQTAGTDFPKGIPSPAPRKARAASTRTTQASVLELSKPSSTSGASKALGAANGGQWTPVALAAPTEIAKIVGKPLTKAFTATTTKPSTATNKLFVLDTNVLLHDPQCLFMFSEHDVYVPMIVLEELDGHKKGTTDVARNARQISRTLDELISAQVAATKKQLGPQLEDGIALAATGHRQAGGLLRFETELLDTSSPLPLALPIGKADNKILSVVQALRAKHADREVILVSNDINMRIKSRALGFVAEAYESDKALDDADLLYSGQMVLPSNFWQTHGKGLESYKEGGNTIYRLSGPLVVGMHINQLLRHEVPGEPTLLLRVQALQGSKAVLSTMRDYSAAKNAVFGAVAKNAEQIFVLNLLMDPSVDFVTILGPAGTGKTLMTLAAGLAQVFTDKRYSEIIMTRATVSMGDDIGFLPGTEEEKMSPWMGALDDNLEVLSGMSRPTSASTGDWTRAHDRESLKERVKVKSMNFMRGRTFLNRYVIIDEAQNLTPKQMKTLITRAGPGTKIVCMGNLAQIDTPYLTEGSSGLTFAVDRFKGWQHGGHITLAKGERSRLADHANDVL